MLRRSSRSKLRLQGRGVEVAGRGKVQRAATLSALVVSAACLFGCSSSVDPASLRVPTHTEYNSGRSAKVSGKLAKDSRGCFFLVVGADNIVYAAYPLKFVATTDTSLTFDGRTYQIGDVVTVGGGGPAETASGFVSPSICPSSGVTLVSPPGP